MFRCTLLLAAACAASASEGVRAALLPLISQLQHQHANRQSQHPQGYERSRGRRLTALSPTNTAPIRLHLEGLHLVLEPK